MRSRAIKKRRRLLKKFLTALRLISFEMLLPRTECVFQRARIFADCWKSILCLVKWWIWKSATLLKRNLSLGETRFLGFSRPSGLLDAPRLRAKRKGERG